MKPILQFSDRIRDFYLVLGDDVCRRCNVWFLFSVFYYKRETEREGTCRVCVVGRLRDMEIPNSHYIIRVI